MKQTTEYAMSKPDVLDTIISQIKAEQVPTKFILMAKIRTYSGAEKLLTGIQLEEIMNTIPDEIVDIRVILDVKMMRDAINEVTDAIFIDLHNM